MFSFRTTIVGLLIIASHTAYVDGQRLPTANPQDVGVSPTTVKELSSHLQSLVDRGFYSGGVTLMARKGHVVHCEAVGLADRETGTPMRTDTIFRIASMTKPITSVAAMILQEQGKLDLNDPIHKFIPEFKNPNVLVSAEPLTTKPAARDITVHDLLTHQSGFIYSIFSPELGALYLEHEINQGLTRTAISLDENMRRLAGLPLLFSPGDRFQYSLSTDVLGYVVERASGKKLDVFMQQQIFQRLNMVDTHFVLPANKLERLAAAYELTDKGLDRVVDGQLRVWEHWFPYTADYAYRGSHLYLSGGAGLCSTAGDYAQFCQMLLNGGVLNGQVILQPSTVEMMMTNQIGDHAGPEGTNKFGLGFAIITASAAVEEASLIDACWWSGAWSTGFTVSPRGDWFVITMVQTFANDQVTPEMSGTFERIAARSIE